MEITIKAEKHRSTTFGLLGKKKAYPIYFQTRWGIHTFSLNFAIDVVVMDEKFRVVEIKQSLPANKVFLWNPKYKNILELPSGTNKKMGIKLNSKIKLIFSNQ